MCHCNRRLLYLFHTNTMHPQVARHQQDIAGVRSLSVLDSCSRGAALDVILRIPPRGYELDRMSRKVENFHPQ